MADDPSDRSRAYVAAGVLFFDDTGRTSTLTRPRAAVTKRTVGALRLFLDVGPESCHVAGLADLPDEFLPEPVPSAAGRSSRH